MNRFLSVALASLFVIVGSHRAGAATWTLQQPSGAPVALTVTSSAIQIARGEMRVEIPVEKVVSVRMRDVQLNGDCCRTPTYDAGFEVDDPGGGSLLAGAGGIFLVATIAAFVEPDAFIEIEWRDGDDARIERIHTGLFTPFIRTRLKAAGLRVN
jgi:hypothetical protein